ncbi:GNAT family N-acetyltransferase [Wenxinia marina]|uniref:Acetyltransferase n=1 Tax=Wenxinia marina DSM 24838 TaxID=1123501 RepID=A0A0D0PG66_9RHOB|nr:GNAT family N-acetyltransferase [Wenxinia marina]KIQ70341.1 Acetyltransferase [Wenxinia marina DSM 24838]GGL53884.1 molybdopterin-guanine dinucleotide biosynthesis protein MobC [Wenxinia marina]
MQIARGFADSERSQVAALYWDAFGGKLGRALGPRGKALAFLGRALDPAHAFVARSAEGEVLGVAGFRTAEGALVAGQTSDMMAAYGALGALWRMAVLGMVARDVDNARFLLDGLAVRQDARGRGVGSRLLEAVAAEAVRRGYREVRLDVIEGNPRARALYERRGFHAVEDQPIGPVRHLFGFSAATVMVRRLG